MGAHRRRDVSQQENGGEGRRDHRQRGNGVRPRKRQVRQQRVRHRDECRIGKNGEAAVAPENLPLLVCLPHGIVEVATVAGSGDPTGRVEDEEIGADRHVAIGVKHAFAVCHEPDLGNCDRGQQHAKRKGDEPLQCDNAGNACA